MSSCRYECWMCMKSISDSDSDSEYEERWLNILRQSKWLYFLGIGVQIVNDPKKKKKKSFIQKFHSFSDTVQRALVCGWHKPVTPMIKTMMQTNQFLITSQTWDL